ncbi:MAG: TIGR04211 family SH3 domain-containing protein [Deferrisomatales bacterium]|nr:TIGR04211 family SH3 domain-containing protein [Deferrisomatales bacterium]
MPALRTALLVLVLVVALAASASARLFVTDQLEVDLRSGPTLAHRIIRMLPSGTPLERLEEQEGWARVRTPAGEEGWLVARYLTSEPPKGPRLEAALRELETLRTEAAQHRGALDGVRTERDRSGAEASRLQARLSEVEKEFADWKATYQDVVTLRERAAELQGAQEDALAELELLRTENRSLKARETFYWFFSGVVVLLLGWVLGYVYASSRQRAKSKSRLRL